MNVYLSGKELAAALNRHRCYVSALKRCGLKPDLGPNRFVFEHVVKWIQEHPSLRIRASAYPPRKRNVGVKDQSVASFPGISATPTRSARPVRPGAK
jgi:hypothetical protein